MAEMKLIEETLQKGDGIFRMIPNFIPRSFGKAGHRMKLHPDDYYACGMESGSITERWFTSSVVANNRPTAKEDEGISYIAVDYHSDEKFSFPEAVEKLGAKMIGEKMMEQYGTWPMFAKFFDNATPLFHHIHPRFEDAARIGKEGKPECYYFPKQMNNHVGEAGYTYFGFDPDTDPQEVKNRIAKFTTEDTRITELSRAYRVELGTGWYTAPGVIHAPASVLTYEPQWNSDVNAVFENVVSGEVYPPHMLDESLPEEDQGNVEKIFQLLDWDACTDKDYKKHYFRPPVVVRETSQYIEKWIAYGNPYVGAKELTVYPGETVTIDDNTPYKCILVQGHGKLGVYDCETPTLIRYGKQTSDEFFVTAAAAEKGVTIVNESKVEPLVMLKHFPYNEEIPQVEE